MALGGSTFRDPDAIPRTHFGGPRLSSAGREPEPKA